MTDIEDIRRDMAHAFPKAALRHGLALQLLESVIIADAIAPNAWCVTCFQDGFRLNIGSIEALVALSGNLRINLVGIVGIPPFTGPHFEQMNYKSSRDPVVAYVGPLDGYMRIKGTLVDSHAHFIQMASTKKNGDPIAGSRYRNSHSPSLIEYARSTVLAAYKHLPSVWLAKLSALTAKQDSDSAQQDYVVYHSERTMGKIYDGVGDGFSFFSGKSETRLRPALGQRVWAISSINKKNPRFFLVGVYTPATIEDVDDLRYLSGKGVHLNPYLEITHLDWFKELYEAQNNFSYGNFNRIQSTAVVVGLRMCLEAAQNSPYPDDLPTRNYYEGMATRVLVNRYERDSRARTECLKHFGTACLVCGLDLSTRYGKIAEGLIHVHHLVPISSVESNYAVDPLLELIPICPNCHAVAHRTDPPMTPDQIRAMLTG